MRTPQMPIGTGFSAASTTADVIDGIDLSGKTAIVTGGDSGLGIETVRTLAGAGATVVVPALDRAVATAALRGVDGVEIHEINLLQPASIEAFAGRFLESGRPLHILVNSAGIMGAPLERDARGFESHFAVNFLGHFELTSRLWPALAAAGRARVVSVSSWGHRYSAVHFEDLHYRDRLYEPLAAYGQSKTADALFAVALDDRGRGYGVRAFTLHPGSAVTPLAKYATEEELKAVGVLDAEGHPVIDPSRDLKSVSQAAATHVWCATSPQLGGMGGVFCMNCDIAPLISLAIQAQFAGPAVRPKIATPLGVMPYAVDPQTADRLWSVSEQLLGLTFL
jgi:NAD(P)-dependent dehydrogenase (short-subunit alcohol dehydrogenase family)